MKQEVRTILETPFTDGQIKQRKGLWGKTLDYIEGHAVIARLNEAFQSDWSFTVTEYRIMDDEVIVVGRLQANDVVKEQFGSNHITREKETVKVMCLGENLKGAATDCLKKCASLFGVGLHLYAADTPSTPNHSNGNGENSFGDNGNGNNGLQLITPKQMKYCLALAHRRNLHDTDLEKYTIDTFGTPLPHITKMQASELIQALSA